MTGAIEAAAKAGGCGKMYSLAQNFCQIEQWYSAPLQSMVHCANDTEDQLRGVVVLGVWDGVVAEEGDR